jgi:NAD(P)-dependent dehydrogenase (short-subunit alcohol dehydrogenase family)
VTGGAGGIGSEMVRAFIETGAAVVVNDLGVTIEGTQPSPDRVTDFVREITDGGGEAVAHYGSVSNFAVAEELIDLAFQRYGRLDAVVTCHGTFIEGSIFDTDEATWDAMIENHLKGTFATVKHGVTRMRDQGSGGSVVCVGSSSGLQGNPMMTPYASAKAGVTTLVKSTALAVGQYDINANTLIPNAVTRVTTRPTSVSQQFWWKGNRPTARLGALVTVALTTPECRDVTGRTYMTTGNSLTVWNQSEETRGETRDDWSLETVMSTFRGAVSGSGLNRFSVYGLRPPQVPSVDAI